MRSWPLPAAPVRCWPGRGELGSSQATDAVQRALHLVDFVLFHGGDDVDAARALKAELLGHPRREGAVVRGPQHPGVGCEKLERENAPAV